MGRIFSLYLMGLVFYKMGCPGQMEGGIRELRDQNSLESGETFKSVIV